MTVADVLTLLLGGGALATIAAIFKGVQALKEGARSKEKDAIADLQDWRRQANDARKLAEMQRDYWRDRAAEYRFILKNEFGFVLSPETPPTSLSEEAGRDR